MSKLVNLITGLIGFGLFAVFIIGLSHSISTGSRAYGRFAVHDHCHFCFGFGAL